jgi:hypothetical protein
MMTVVRTIRVLMLILLMGLAPVASFAQSDAWERHIRAGISAYQQGNYNEAEDRYLAAIKVAPTTGAKDSR